MSQEYCFRRRKTCYPYGRVRHPPLLPLSALVASLRERQVFATVNSFLREDPAARKRRLRVFTYTIVPLSPDSGVLEWVEDTMPFGSFLTDRGSGKAGAHRRYFPKDWCVFAIGGIVYR